MRTEIYTLDKDDLSMLSGVLPEYVIERADLPGYFSLGAVANVGGEDTLTGVAQFYININADGECFAEVLFVYVLEEYRRQGVGTKLVERINRILKKSDVKTSTLLIPEDADEIMGFETGGKDLENFFKECSYISTREEMAVWRTELGSVLADVADKKANKSVHSLDEITVEDFTTMMQKMVEDSDESDPIPEDLKLDDIVYDRDLSSYYSRNDGEGAILFQRYGNSAVEVALLRGYGKDADKRLPELVIKSLLAVRDNMDEGALLIVKDRAVSTGSDVTKLIPGISELEMKKYVRLTSR